MVQCICDYGSQGGVGMLSSGLSVREGSGVFGRWWWRKAKRALGVGLISRLFFFLVRLLERSDLGFSMLSLLFSSSL